MSVAKEYYLEHGLDQDFPYFNADKYLDLYKDVAALTGGDRYKALLHYLETGLFEHRSSGTSFDPDTAIAKYPILLIVFSVRSSEDNPALFVESLFEAYWDYENTCDIIIPGGGQQEDVNKTFTMLYCACTGNRKDTGEWNWARNIVRALLGDYLASDEFNLVFMFGGTTTWYPSFIEEELGAEQNEGNYVNAIYSVDKEALKSAVSKLMDDNGWDINTIRALIEKQREYTPGKAANIITDSLVTGEVLKKMTEVGPIYEPDAFSTFVDQAKTVYPADNYGLIIGGHGGGASSGSPASAPNNGEPGKALSIPDLSTAFQNSGVADDPFSILIYDSCLMGSSEVADYLSPYYKYMYACETVSYRGSTNYADYFPYISDVRNDDNLAYLLAMKAIDLVYQVGLTRTTPIRTGAIFDPSKSAAAMSGLNEVAKALNSLLDDVSEADRIELFNSLRLSAICSYQITVHQQVNLKNNPYRDNSGRGYLDLRDFLIKLKTCLPLTNTEDSRTKSAIENLCAENGILATAIRAADELTKSNFLMVENAFIYTSKDGNATVTEITPNLWDTCYEYQMCGASVYFPYFNVTKSLTSNNRTNLKPSDLADYLEENINKYYLQNVEKYQRYQGQGYDDYIELVRRLLEFLTSKDEFARELNLAEVLAGEKNTDTKKYATYRDLLDVNFKCSTPDNPLPKCFC